MWREVRVDRAFYSVESEYARHVRSYVVDVDVDELSQ